MNTQILYPDQVVVYRIGSDNKVTIVAKGREDGYCKIKIEQSMATIYPPIFMVSAEPCSVEGSFPYTVQKTIPYALDLDYLQFQTERGTERIAIHDVMEDIEDSKITAITEVETNENQVVGYAYNSSNINKAIEDAVAKLRKKFSNGVSARMVDSGFVAGGSPVGIAYYYVVMEQI